MSEIASLWYFGPFLGFFSNRCNYVVGEGSVYPHYHLYTVYKQRTGLQQSDEHTGLRPHPWPQPLRKPRWFYQTQVQSLNQRLLISASASVCPKHPKPFLFEWESTVVGDCAVCQYPNSVHSYWHNDTKRQRRLCDNQKIKIKKKIHSLVVSQYKLRPEINSLHTFPMATLQTLEQFLGSRIRNLVPMRIFKLIKSLHMLGGFTNTNFIVQKICLWKRHSFSVKNVHMSKLVQRKATSCNSRSLQQKSKIMFQRSHNCLYSVGPPKWHAHFVGLMAKAPHEWVRTVAHLAHSHVSYCLQHYLHKLRDTNRHFVA